MIMFIKRFQQCNIPEKADAHTSSCITNLNYTALCSHGGSKMYVQWGIGLYAQFTHFAQNGEIA